MSQDEPTPSARKGQPRPSGQFLAAAPAAAGPSGGRIAVPGCARLGERSFWSLPMVLLVEVEQEADGRWLAEVREMPGVMAYGASRLEAVARAQALALRVVADRLDHDEAGPELLELTFRSA